MDEATNKNPQKSNVKRLLNAVRFLVKTSVWIGIVLILVAAAYLWYLSVPRLVVHANDGAKSRRVLFIGNSITFNHDVPGLLVKLVRAGHPNERIEIRSFTRAGATLDELLQVELLQNALKEDWDCVIIQPDSAAGFGGPSVLNGELSRTIKLTKSGVSKCTVVMTAGDKAFFVDQGQISQAYRRSARDLKLRLLPFGDLMFYGQERLPELEFYDRDEHHASQTGAMVYAIGAYKILFKDELVKDKVVNGIEGEEKELVQKLWDVINDFERVAKYRCEFSKESEGASQDLAELWVYSGLPEEAERLSARRLEYVNRIFPSKDRRQTFVALKELANAQMNSPDPAKIKEGEQNVARAFKIMNVPAREDRWRISDLTSTQNRARLRREVEKAKANFESARTIQATGVQKGDAGKIAALIKQENEIASNSEKALEEKEKVRREIATAITAFSWHERDELMALINGCLTGTGLGAEWGTSLSPDSKELVVGHTNGSKLLPKYILKLN